ncbi:MAG: hypothetical protein SFU21_09845 [Flavihumibacter sp.]|nr:hypothetical protein [Flavihumibacter sp.]
MKNQLLNQQDYIAERFRYVDDHVQQLSKLALLKIQSLQLSRKNRFLGALKKQEMEEYLHASLLNLVPNTYVLSEEGFYFATQDN